MQGFGLVLIFATAGLILNGCQTQSVSLDEAKKITADFSEAAFIPPPRSVIDISKILNEARDVGRSEIETRKATAASKPSQTSNKYALAEYYYDRAHANDLLGDSQKALSDYRQAITLARENGNSSQIAQFSRNYSIAEIKYGNYRTGVTAMKRAVDEARQKWVDGGRRGGIVGLIARLGLLANQLIGVGDIETAEQYLDDAEELVSELNLSSRAPFELKDLAGRVLDMEKGTLLMNRGDFRGAEELMRRSVDKFTLADSGYDKTYEEKLRGQTYYRQKYIQLLLAQGRAVEAEVRAREITKEIVDAFGRNSAHTLWAVNALTHSLYGQGRYHDAALLASASIDIHKTIGVPSSSLVRAKAHAILGASLMQQKLWSKALSAYQETLPTKTASPKAYDVMVASKLGWPTSLIRLGKFTEAKAHVTPVLKKLESTFGPDHRRTAAVRAILAAANVGEGNSQRALEGFRASVPILMDWSLKLQGKDPLFSGEPRRLIFDAYLKVLAQKHLDPGVAAEAFALAGFARESSVRKALGSSVARAAINDPALADLARREQDAIQQILTLSEQLNAQLSKPAISRPQGVVASLKQRISDLNLAQKRLAQNVREQNPKYAELTTPKPTTIKSIQQSLHRNEALISTYVAEDATYVWALNASGTIAMAVSGLGRQDITLIVEAMRKAVDPGAISSLGDIPKYDLAAAHQLFEQLLSPTKSVWGRRKNLLIVADGPLGYIPLAMLPTAATKLAADDKGLFSGYSSVPWLIRDYAVTNLPSAGSLVALRGLGQGSITRKPFAGIGDPFFNRLQALEHKRVASKASTSSRGISSIALRSTPKTSGLPDADITLLPRLPDTRTEILKIGKLMGADTKRDLFLGERANEQQVKSAPLNGYRVISFATHGLRAGEMNGLTEPAIALSSPKVSKTRGDGFLTTSEILSLRLDADWVVLSACNTAAGNGAGAEAVSGLGRAFFYAGSRSVLASNWPVHSAATAVLMTELFERQTKAPTTPRAESLRQAMVAMIDNPGFKNQKGQVVFSYAHPIFWAPFAIYGDGGS